MPLGRRGVVGGGGGQCSPSPAVRMEMYVSGGGGWAQETPGFCCLRGGGQPQLTHPQRSAAGQPRRGGGMGPPPPPNLGAPAPPTRPRSAERSPPPLPHSRAGSGGCTQPSHVGCPPRAPHPAVCPGQELAASCPHNSLPALLLPGHCICSPGKAFPPPCSPLGSGNCSSSSGNPALVGSGGAEWWGHSCATGITSGAGGEGHPQLWGRAGGFAQGQTLWGGVGWFVSSPSAPGSLWGGDAMPHCFLGSTVRGWGACSPHSPHAGEGTSCLESTASNHVPTVPPFGCRHNPTGVPPCPHCGYHYGYYYTGVPPRPCWGTTVSPLEPHHVPIGVPPSF